MADKQDALRIAPEATDKMIDAACNAVPGLYRVDAMRAIEAALSAQMDAAQHGDAQPATATRCAHCGHMHATEECAWNHLRYNHPVADQPENKPALPKSIKCATCGIDLNSDAECIGYGRCTLPGFEPPAAPAQQAQALLEREAFRAWMRGQDGPQLPSAAFSAGAKWQARAALTPQDAQTSPNDSPRGCATSSDGTASVPVSDSPNDSPEASVDRHHIADGGEMVDNERQADAGGESVTDMELTAWLYEFVRMYQGTLRNYHCDGRPLGRWISERVMARTMSQSAVAIPPAPAQQGLSDAGDDRAFYREWDKYLQSPHYDANHQDDFRGFEYAWKRSRALLSRQPSTESKP